MADTTSFHTLIEKRPVLTWVADFGKNTLETLSMVILHMQVSRMKSVLHQMSDTQLEHVGIKRSQINAHAEKLMDV